MDKVRAKDIINALRIAYPNAHCELDYDNEFHLLVSVILSAQCTDKRVNQVTPRLYKVYSTPNDFATADFEKLCELIYSCGFYRAKAKSLISASTDIVNKYDGKVPNTFDELIKLRGVGRKTANVMMSVAFGGDNIAVDTHVFRVSKRLGFSSGKTPYEVEKDLNCVLDKSDYSIAHHLLIFHGRYCCKAQNPACDTCPIKESCFYSANK